MKFSSLLALLILLFGSVTIHAQPPSPSLCPVCGEGICEINENCPDDCGGAVCGDFFCELNENCPDDCGSVCGDGICFPPEDSTDCPDDCTGIVCGDASCDTGENCPDDCGGWCCTTDADCDDHNACNGIERCNAGTCIAGTPPNCDDDNDNVCTDGACDPLAGCVYTNNTLPCNDGNACTQTDTCQNGTCTGSNPIICTASDSCHVAGTCDPATGSCDNPPALNCDDGNACTIDSCQVKKNGIPMCKHTRIKGCH